MGDSNKATRVVATLDQGGALRRCLNYRQWVFRCGVPGLAGGWWRADNHHEGLAGQKIQDIFSAGYVLAELLLGQLIFPRDSGVEQLVEMIKISIQLAVCWLSCYWDSSSSPGTVGWSSW
ncbi:uncharacterized protein [Narcine bancroftii]|uniref:uncharacterized protein isoform X2 n=1 Tax=Narcine bancroftii TaxID=1343680 RepID=UPI00383140F9